MSRFSNTGVHFKHSKLSNRTKESVNETLGHSKMSDCLVSMVDPEMCGDGIIQGDEVLWVPLVGNCDSLYSQCDKNVFRNVIVVLLKCASQHDLVVFKPVKEELRIGVRN